MYVHVYVLARSLHCSGKRVENIAKLLDVVFDEAAQRQPSCVLLDDLDTICRGTDAQQEVSGEAAYFSRIAHGWYPASSKLCVLFRTVDQMSSAAVVVRKRLKRELSENTSLLLVVTCRSRSSLHEALAATKGLALFQHVAHIKTPNAVSFSSF